MGSSSWQKWLICKLAIALDLQRRSPFEERYSLICAHMTTHLTCFEVIICCLWSPLPSLDSFSLLSFPISTGSSKWSKKQTKEASTQRQKRNCDCVDANEGLSGRKVPILYNVYTTNHLPFPKHPSICSDLIHKCRFCGSELNDEPSDVLRF